MNKYKKEYYVIIRKIINKSYPNLKGKTIWIKEGKHKVLKGIAITPFPNKGLIILNISTRKKSKNYKIALIAHELAHISQYIEMGWFGFLIDTYKYLFKSKYRSKVEWETDKIVIKKGYAKQNYEYCKGRDEIRKKYGYMTSSDIKKYAQSIKKW